MSALPPSEPNACFVDSRRLTGPNRYWPVTAVVLEPRGQRARDAAAHAHWRLLVSQLRYVLELQGAADPPEHGVTVDVHRSAVFLAMSAPEDVLFTATEINEWAWEVASGCFGPTVERDDDGRAFDRVHPVSIEDAPHHFGAKARNERNARNPNIHALFQAVAERGLPIFNDDDRVSIGVGKQSLSWAHADAPHPEAIDWTHVADAPIALVTGSNGKTTTVRLIAAMLKAAGKRVGISSTEGIVIDGEPVESGDYSGPAGARQVLRDSRVEAAVLETARGGIARRGLAVSRADVAVVTNISADHFGEYGIDSLDDLADVKLTVASVLGANGTLVLNADDATLAPRIARFEGRCKLSAFAASSMADAVLRAKAKGATTAGVDVRGHLVLSDEFGEHDLGSIHAMPLTVGGAATYNIANICGAVLAATAVDVGHDAIRLVLTSFGRDPSDNTGRLERWRFKGAEVIVDYAHNPAGLDGLLKVAASLRSVEGRVGLLLGQAGNREDDAIAALAATAVPHKPDRIVVKELHKFLRGRPEGEVPALLKAALLQAGYPTHAVQIVLDEMEAAKTLLDWAREGDVVVLPVHQAMTRDRLRAIFQLAIADSSRDD